MEQRFELDTHRVYFERQRLDRQILLFSHSLILGSRLRQILLRFLWQSKQQQQYYQCNTLQKQVRQQDAYRQTRGVQLKLCATPHPPSPSPFQGQHLRRWLYASV